jgi:hypothetical protein
VIKVIISDKHTYSKIWLSYVYFNGTFAGTTSDEHGYFELDISKHSSMPITISAIGYYSLTMTNFSVSEPLMVYLTPKVFELSEIVVSARSDPKNRKENLQLFRTAFLGKTANAQKCKIINESDITFDNLPDNDTLKAFASNPIMIENKALGYKITYYLDRFEYYKNSKTILFYGNIIFTEDATMEETKKETIEHRRKYAYLGSRMHFFRALWTDSLASAGFTIKSPATEKLDYKDIIFIDVNGEKYLKNSENLSIRFNKSISNIVFLHENTFFAKNGYFDPLTIGWKGEMAKQRIADWLPYEYTAE